MKCPCCKKDIIERNGKFGPFLCCPSGKHGTFSIQGVTMYFTGEIGQMLRNKRVEDFYNRLKLESISNGVKFQPKLSQLINSQVASWGWNPSLESEQIAEYSVGDPNNIWDDEERENSDNWWTHRP